MATSGIAGLHLIRFGTAADQEYFLKSFADTYDQIVVNANIVAHMPAAMATFLAVRAKKPFFIDPQTVAFQHEVDHLLSSSKKSVGEIKRSWKRIIKRYGDPIERVLNPQSPRSVLPEDFDNSDECRAFCERVADFQKDVLSDEFSTGEDSDYVKYIAQEEGGTELVSPTLIIAPYFFLNASFLKEWTTVNLRCLEYTRDHLKKQKSTKPLAAQLILSQQVLLNEPLRRKLISDYSNCVAKPDLFLLWIDSFTEQEVSLEELQAYVSLVKELSSTGAGVVNLHGGFFSVAAARFGPLKDKLIGVCHGLEYGESKRVVPISGGIPVAKFYLPVVHSRMAARVATRAIRALNGFKSVETFRTEICDCEVCRSVIKIDPATDFRAFAETKISAFWRSGRRVAMEFPTADTADLCAKHYMRRKHVEYTEATTLDEVNKSLSATFERLKAHVGLEFVGHCAIWPKALRENG